MKKTLLVNLALLLSLNALIKPFYLFGIDRKFQLALGTENYGLYYNLFSFALILQVLNDFGMQNFTSRYASQNPQLIRQKFNELMGFKLLLSATYLIASLVLAGLYYSDAEATWYILHLACNQILVSLIQFLRANIVGLGRYKTDSILSVLDRFLLICFGLMALNISSIRKYLDIGFFISIQSLSLIICAFIAAAICVRYGFNLKPDFRFNLPFLKSMIQNSTPFFLIGLFFLLNFRQDNIILRKMLNDPDLHIGIYASSMRLYEAATLVSLTFGSLLLVLFSKVHSDRAMINKLFEWSNTGLWIITLIIAITVIPNAEWINEILYHQSDSYWNGILVWCFLAFLPGSLNYILGAFFQAVHLEQALWKLYGVGFVVNALFNILFIPHFKAMSCAYALFLTQLVLFLAQLIILNRKKMLLWNAELFYRFLLLAFFAFAWAALFPAKDWVGNMVAVGLINGLVVSILSIGGGLVKLQSINEIITKHLPTAMNGTPN